MTRRALFTLVVLASLASAAAAARAGAPAAGPAAAPHLTEVLRTAERRPSREIGLPEVDAAAPAHSVAPYFVVPAEDGNGERLPLEETRAGVSVAGPIARIQVTQVFRNRGPKPIEAVYVFPASTRAAVHGMRLKIGERTVEAVIRRRDEARATYEQARADGKRAALLDEERPNVFTMHVANVMPGDRVVAELDYSELIVPEQGVYELVYPAVVGPRYGGGADPAKDGWIANPTLHQGEAAPYRFGFAAHLESALPIRDLASPSHAVDVTWRSPGSADVALHGEGGGDRDVILRWRLAGDAVQAGALVLPDGNGGGWFMATVEPPERVAPEQIPPRELVFVLDVSGSMHGFPLDTAKALMRELLPRLRPTDRFNIVFFSGGSFVLSPAASLPATPDNVRRALDTFDRLEGGGGTELLQALQKAYDLPRPDVRMARSVVVVTDGYVAVEADAFRLVRERLGEASCFAFGIGSSVNRALIEALARAGQGEPTVVTSPEGARAASEKLTRVLSTPVLSHLAWHAEGVEVADVLPGALPDLLAERPVVLLGRYTGAPRGKIVVEGQSATGRFRQEVDLASAPAGDAAAPLRVLWARRWVEVLLDELHMGHTPELQETITSLGLGHHLLTPFTSFVAVDSEVVNRGGEGEQVKQPLPMPAGVSDLALPSAPAAKLANARVAREFVAAAPRPPPPPAAMAGKADVREPEAAEAAKAAPSAQLTVARLAVTGLRDAPALEAAVLRALAPLGAEGARGEVEVLLTVDAKGAVTVRLLRAGDPGLGVRVLRALEKLTTSARPAGGASGTCRLKITLS